MGIGSECVLYASLCLSLVRRELPVCEDIRGWDVSAATLEVVIDQFAG